MVKEYRNVNILSSKLLKAKEQNKVTFITAEIEKLKNNIEEREKDLFYADSWEQSGQISKDIERMKIKFDYLTKQEENEKIKKESVMGNIKKYKDNGKEMLKSRKEVIKEMRDKYFID